MTVRFFIAILATLSALGCSPPRYAYVPVQTTNAQIARDSGAIYAVPPESPRGDVRVVTAGIAPLFPHVIEDSTVRALQLALVVANRSDEPWSVDGAEQQVVLPGGAEGVAVHATTSRVTRPARVVIPPRSTRRIDFIFPPAARGPELAR